MSVIYGIDEYSKTRKGMNRKKFNTLSIVVLLMISLVSVVAFAKIKADSAPDFVLKSASGDNVRLSELKGRVVMLNFWATWCGPCAEEIPHLNELHESLDPYDFELLGINLDEDQSKAIHLANKLEVNFPVLFDSEKDVSRSFDIKAMPTTIIIDRAGKIRHVNHGFKKGYIDRYYQQVQALRKE
ncbi:MAG: TlpA family protein disulfide reductase [Gammaproteobacteria bacterium]